MRFAPLAALLLPVAAAGAQAPASAAAGHGDHGAHGAPAKEAGRDAGHDAMHAAHHAADAQTRGGVSIPGWQVRFDGAAAKAEQVTAAPMGKGLHFTSGPAAIYWNPQTSATGAYTATASFTQTKAPMHPEAYGLVVGGRDLAADGQRYLYFIVRGDGKYAIKHRAGKEVHTIADWTANPAVKAADAAGKATNVLAVKTDAQTVRFLVNGTEVKSLPRAQAMDVDGLVGVRVNHMLDLHVDGLAVTK